MLAHESEQRRERDLSVGPEVDVAFYRRVVGARRDVLFVAGEELAEEFLLELCFGKKRCCG